MKTLRSCLAILLLATPMLAESVSAQSCAPPGEIVVDDPEGDTGLANLQQDIEFIGVTERCENFEGWLLTITLEVVALAPEPEPNRLWTVRFVNDGTEYFFAMSTCDPVDPQFSFGVYGGGFGSGSPLFGYGSWSTDGSITFEWFMGFLGHSFPSETTTIESIRGQTWTFDETANCDATLSLVDDTAVGSYTTRVECVGEDCVPLPVDESTWGRIKALYAR